MFAPLLLVTALLADPTITSPVGTGRPAFAGDGGPAAEAQLNGPFDVACDAAGNLFFSDTGNHRIRRVDAATGVISTIAGSGEPGFSGDGGPATRAALNEPYGVVLDARGNLYFADRLNARVRRIEAASGAITTVAGTGEQGSDGDGGPAAEARLVEPNGVALDPRGRLLIADVAAHRVRAVDLATGRIATFAGDGRPRHAGDGGPATAASLHGARAVEVAPDGAVLILEREGNTLRAVAPDGTIRTLAGTGQKGQSGDGGPALQATFNGPKELAIDPRGHILIVDTENHAIRRIDAADGRITTIAGDGQPGAEGDGGPPTRARLDRPHGVAVAPDGRIWIGDTGNHRLRRLDP